MNGWLERVVAGALVIGAAIWVVRALVLKFKSPGCGDACNCGCWKRPGPGGKSTTARRPPLAR
jgi:hypothetical protein